MCVIISRPLTGAPQVGHIVGAKYRIAADRNLLSLGHELFGMEGNNLRGRAMDRRLWNVFD
jgi:hypothetical protein